MATNKTVVRINPEDMILAIGEDIRNRREAAGITLAALAAKARVSKGNLSKIENGKGRDIGFVTFARIYLALGETFGVEGVEMA
jgi:transcriptional regulator with XRE-family HTH domain